MPGGMVVSTVWVLAALGESNLQRARRTVPPDSPTYNRTHFGLSQKDKLDVGDWLRKL